MRIAWVTDIHLDHADTHHIQRFCHEIVSTDSDIVLIGGDIGEAPTVERYLRVLEDRLQRPIYFVLGNHDYYKGSIAQVREQAETITGQSRWLHWLPVMGIVELTPQTCLVGHDGWSDGRFGDFHGSPVQLNDYIQIEELRALSKQELFSKLNALGDEAANYLRWVLEQALPNFREVILLMHPPPFREACLYQGKPGNDKWLPHFTCKAVGDVLKELMAMYPDCRMTVLCGHTHGAANVEILPKLTVRTGEANYGEPQLQAIFNIASGVW